MPSITSNPPKIDIARLRRSILADPVQAAETYFRFQAQTWEQADLIRSPFKFPRTIFSSGTSLGKTYSYKVLPWLWILSAPLRGVIIMSTDFTALDEKIWPMVSEGHGDCAFPIGGHLTTELWCGDQRKQWPRIIKMSPKNIISAQGWHPPGGLLVLIDEASYLCEPGKTPLLRALEGSASGESDAMVMTMNPTHATGPAVEALEGPDYEDDGVMGWHKIIQSSLDSPNVIAGYDKVPGFCSRQRVELVRKRDGEDSYEWRVKILGVPPTEDELTVIAPSMVDKAVAAYQVTEFSGVVGKIVVGIDTSLTLAGDENTLWARDDRRVLVAEGLRADTSLERYAWAVGLLRDIERTWGKVSDVNVDRMGDPELCGRLIADGFNVNPIGFGDPPHDPGVYRNQRAEMAFGGKIWLRERGGMMSPEAGKRLRPECVVQRKPGGDVKQLEDKDAVKKRIKRSCDNFDGFILLFAEKVGISAFPTSLSACLIPAAMKPVVLRLQNWNSGQYQWRIGLAGQAREYSEDGMRVRLDRPGTLHRAMWLSRNSESACVWIHVDEPDLWDKRSPVKDDPGGCCTVIDVMTWPVGAGIGDIARDVAGRSRDANGFWHDYGSDGACGNDTGGFLNSVCEVMGRESRFTAGMGMVPLPGWYPAETIGGKKGLDILSDLVAGSIQKREGAMLLTHLPRVLADLEAVMVSSPKEGGWGLAAAKEELQDSSVIKALRLWAVSSQPV